jgi:hypothetical protein
MAWWMFIVESQDRELLQHSKQMVPNPKFRLWQWQTFSTQTSSCRIWKPSKPPVAAKEKKNKCQTKYGNVQGRSNVFKLLQNTSRSFKVLQKEKEMPSVLESSDWLLIYSCRFARRKQSSWSRDVQGGQEANSAVFLSSFGTAASNLCFTMSARALPESTLQAPQLHWKRKTVQVCLVWQESEFNRQVIHVFHWRAAALYRSGFACHSQRNNSRKWCCHPLSTSVLRSTVIWYSMLRQMSTQPPCQNPGLQKLQNVTATLWCRMGLQQSVRKKSK